jgi:hypothetical protein
VLGSVLGIGGGGGLLYLAGALMQARWVYFRGGFLLIQASRPRQALVASLALGILSVVVVSVRLWRGRRS